MSRVFLSDSLVNPDFKSIKRGPFVDANGDLWLVYMQSTTSVIVRKSSDKGATWPTDAEYFFGDYISAGMASYVFDVEFDATNGVFYFLYATPYPNVVGTVRKFTISSGTFAAFSTGTGPTIIGGSGSHHYAANLLLKSDGSFTVVHAGQNTSMGSNYDAVYYSPITSAGAWGNRVLISPSSAANYGLCAAAIGASNRIHVAYWYEVSGAVYHRSLSGTTLDTAAQISTLTTQDYGNKGQFGFAPGSGYLYFSSNNSMFRCTSGANPTWTAFSTSPSYGVSPDIPGQICNQPIVYDTVNSLMRVFFQGNNHTGYLFENYTNGTTWPNSQATLNTENSWIQQMSANFVHDNNNTFGLGIFYSDQGAPYYIFIPLEPINYTETATVASTTSLDWDETYTPAAGTIYTESATVASVTTVSPSEVYTAPPALPLPYIGYLNSGPISAEYCYNVGPHEDANGNWWIVYVNYDTGKLTAFKSTDNGTTWDSGTSTSDMDYDTFGAITACLDEANQKLYVAISGGDWTPYDAGGYWNPLKIMVFDVNAQTWSRFDSGTIPDQIYYGGKYPPLILLQLSDGSFVLVYSGLLHSDMGADYTSCHYVPISASGVWGTPVEIDAGGGYDYRPQDAIVGASDRVHIIFTGTDDPEAIPGRTYAYHRSLSGTTLDTTQTVAGPFGDNSGLGPGFTLGYVSAHDELLLCMSEWLMRASSTADPTFTEDIDPFTGVAWQTRVQAASLRVCFWHDATNDKLYVVYYGGNGYNNPPYGIGTNHLFWRGVYDYATDSWSDPATLMFPAYAEAYTSDTDGYSINGFGGDSEALAQTFKLAESRTIKGIPIYSTYHGTTPPPSDGFYVELRQDGPTGTLLRTTTSFFTSYMFGTVHFFDFATPITLVAGTTYCMVFKRGWSYYAPSGHNLLSTKTKTIRDDVGTMWISNSGVWSTLRKDLIFGLPMDPNLKIWAWIKPTVDGFGFLWYDYSSKLYTTEFRFGATTYLDAPTIESTTSISYDERGPFTDFDTPATTTTLTTDDTYGRTEVAEVASVTSIQSDDQYHLGTTLDEATVASATSLSSTEVYGNAAVYTDLAAVESDTQVSFDEARTFGYVDATTVDSRTQVTSEDIYTTPITYTDAATVASTTSVSAIETYALPAAAIASFSWRSLGGGKVQFYDTSKGVVTSWYWDFGDGTFSTEQNPIHTYATGGTYTVTLTINGDITLTATHTVRAHYSHTPQDTLIDGQIAIGTDGSFHWSVGGVWYTAQWAPSIVNAVPQDCVLGQVAIGLDDSFHWYDGTEWHSFAEAEA